MLVLGGIGLLVVVGGLLFPSHPPMPINDSQKLLLETKARAEHGEAQAQHDLGIRYLMSWDVKRDYAEAAKWFRKSAEQNFATAQFQLADCYLTGRGVALDQKEAVRWYRKAAEQGDIQAQRRLGDRFARGEGVTKDLVEAVKWVRQAAEQGDISAQETLRDCYANGLGVTQDVVEAYAWNNLVANGNRGYTPLQRVRPNFEKTLSQQQIAAGYTRMLELRALIDAKLKSVGK